MTDNIKITDTIKLFSDMGQALTAIESKEQVLHVIKRAIDLFFKPSNWSLLRLDDNTNELFFMVAEGIDSAQIQHVTIKLGEGIAGKVAATGNPEVMKFVDKNSNYCRKVDEKTAFQTQSIIAVPLFFRRKVLGVLELINVENPDEFQGDKMLLLSAIANFAAAAISTSSLYVDMVASAETDPLTGAYNRRKLENFIKHCQIPPTKFHRKNEVIFDYLCVAMIDLNKFKPVNDHYGHQAGDEILITAVKHLKDAVREDDLVIRMGGDEFLVCLLHVNPLMEKDVVTLLEEKLETISQQLPYEVSFAHYSACGPCKHVVELIEKADKGMYKHKQSKSNGNPLSKHG